MADAHEMRLAVTPAPTETGMGFDGEPKTYTTGPAIGRILLGEDQSVQPGEKLVVVHPIVTKGGTLT